MASENPLAQVHILRIAGLCYPRIPHFAYRVIPLCGLLAKCNVDQNHEHDSCLQRAGFEWHESVALTLFYHRALRMFSGWSGFTAFFLTAFSWQKRKRKKERKLVIQYLIVQNIDYRNVPRKWALALSIFPLGPSPFPSTSISLSLLFPSQFIIS